MPTWHDLRLAVRGLARTPVFTLVALATLALGIGANTAVFTVVRAVLLRELPYEAPDRLVELGHTRAEYGVVFGGFSPQDVDDVHAGAGDFSSLSAYFYIPGLGTRNLTGLGEPRNVAAVMADGRLFATLGVSAVRGRAFTEADDVPGANQVVVLSDAFWRSQLEADPDVVGRVVQFDGLPFRVIGVMPPAFTFPSAEAEVWMPLSVVTDDDVPHVRSVRWLHVVARLAPGVTPVAAEAQFGEILAGLEQTYPGSNADWGRPAMESLSEHLLGDVRTPLIALMLAVGLVMLIASVNVAHLMLARGLGRVRELSIRSALGATRARLVGQLLLESAVLALAGAAAGLMLAWIGVPLIAALAADTLPRAGEIAVDPMVTGFALLAGVAVFLVVGILPALRSAEPSGDTSLRQGHGQSGASHRLAGGLLAAETAFALLLLCGAALTLSSLWKLTHVDPGFRAERVVTMRLALQGGRYETAGEPERFRRQFLARLAEIPGVEAVGGGKRAPLTGGGEPYRLTVTRGDGSVDTVTPGSGVFMVSPGYFEALSIPLVRGRGFTLADSTMRPLSVVVSAGFARRTWPGAEAVGQRFRLGPAEGVVVGVAADVRHEDLRTPPATAAYVPLAVFSRSAFNGYVKVAGSPLNFIGAVRSAVRELDPDLPISDLGPLSSRLKASVAQPRLFTLLLGLFGGTALLLAALGVYGVVAQGVARRRREIGIRMVLGAHAPAVVRLVVSAAFRAAAVGAGIGLVGFLAASRLVRSQLYQVEPTDPVILTLAAVILLGTALLAAWLPARRATRIDPMLALRAE